MKLFFREYFSLIVLQIIQAITTIFILSLSGYDDYAIIGYCLLINTFLFLSYLCYAYTTRQKVYHRLSEKITRIDESIQQLDYAPLSQAVEKLLRSQYNLYQENMVCLQKKQEEHLIFIDRWIHQMKTPLSILELSAKELDEPDSSNIREEIDRLKSGLSTVMYMSKLRTIEKDFHIKRVHLPTLLEEIQRENRRLFIQHEVYPTMDRTEDLVVETDEKWLFFIINQLISNAVKYTAGKANKVSFSIYERDHKRVLEIKDFGVGIPQSDMKRIFQAFYTGENGRHFRESTGVGLYIVHEVIRYLDHQIEVESTVHVGTTFRILFS